MKASKEENTMEQAFSISNIEAVTTEDGKESGYLVHFLPKFLSEDDMKLLFGKVNDGTLIVKVE